MINQAGNHVLRKVPGDPGGHHAEQEQCAFAEKQGSGILGWRRTLASRLRQVILTFHSVLVRPHVECLVQFQYKKGVDI